MTKMIDINNMPLVEKERYSTSAINTAIEMCKFNKAYAEDVEYEYDNEGFVKGEIA